MKTKIIACLTLLGFATTAIAQRHGGRENERREQAYTLNSRSYHGEARHTVIVTPAFPRVIIRPSEPTIVIERKAYRRDYRTSYDNRTILSDEELCQINRRLQNMRMDDDKVNYIKDKIDLYFVSSSQISDMLYIVSFESNRLELAKYAYEKTIDPQNYSLVFNTLDFNSSKRDLDQYIENQNICRR